MGVLKNMFTAVKMLTKEQKARLLSLWERGLMTTNRRHPYISALAEEAAEVGVSWHQTASFVKAQRVKTGLNRLDPEVAGLLVTAVQALGDLRVCRGTSLENTLEDIMAIMSPASRGPRQPWPAPSEQRPSLPSAECPPLPPRPTGQPMAFGPGQGDDDDRLLPTPVAFPTGTTIVDVAAGAMHSAFLTSAGEIWTAGCNDDGSLARVTSDEEDCQVVASTSPSPARVAAQVACGDSFTAVLDTLAGRRQGAAQHGPLLVEVTGLEAPARKISAGAQHLAVLTTDNRVFTLGCAGRGQLGSIRERLAEKKSSRELLMTPRPWSATAANFTDVVCGGYNTIAITSTDDVFGCGANHLCQLALSQRGVTQVAIGDYHGIALCYTGHVIAWGGGRDGALGVGRLIDTPLSRPQPVPGLPPNIRQAAAGPRVSFCRTSEGHVYSWGSGVCGQLGTGQEELEVPAPVPVKGLPGPAQNISAGGQHVLLLCDLRIPPG
ncbi:RCC1 [Branchiostoma lanceolatum]|uniref:RCC1 protein n=1 Tax=Branchiostoma lanceolatum TaxID=7740 RepID=A0A8K0EPB0_BRALA|nr:RCC1 [Branchiostoma lanceolatum]